MPNERLNKIVTAIDKDGQISYRFWSPPQLIIQSPTRLCLKPPMTSLAVGETLLTKGYRHCPTHWEWVLLLRANLDIARDLAPSMRSGASIISENSVEYTTAPVFRILTEENEWKNKGGSPHQVLPGPAEVCAYEPG